MGGFPILYRDPALSIKNLFITSGLDTPRQSQGYSTTDITYNLKMPRVLYTAFDIVPSPKGASTHILHNLRGLVNRQFDVHLLTPNDGVLPSEDTLEGARVTRI